MELLRNHDSEGPHLLMSSSLIDAVRTHLPAEVDLPACLDAGQQRDLVAALAAVPDPRARRGVRYRLASLLAVAVCAVLAGACTFAAPPRVKASDNDAVDGRWLGLAGGTSRDFWDWVVVGGAAASVVISVVAVGLAFWAAREASLARRAVAYERKRVFELDVLRSLLESVDQVDTMTSVLFNMHLFIAGHEARLSVLPRHELPTWRALVFDGKSLPDVISADDTERNKIYEELRRQSPGDPAFTRRRSRERLRADLLAAINSRMAARDN